ncbi:MAG: helicase-related protein, partial [Endozoicomonas sp.]
GKWKRALVFVRTKKAANRIAELLEQDGIHAQPIHSDINQYQRVRTLEDFKDGYFNVLVATDVAARGLDIEQLPLVINFDLPKVPQDYVHRIGRTGRAGQPGRAISLVNPEEKKLIDTLQKLIGHQIQIEPVPYFEDGEVRLNEPEAPAVKSRRQGIKPDLKSKKTAIKKYINKASGKRSGNKPATGHSRGSESPSEKTAGRCKP